MVPGSCAKQALPGTIVVPEAASKDASLVKTKLLGE